MSENITLQADRAFRRSFGRAPKWIASAPGRVNLIGEFTDFNGGFVLPMAIERRTAIAATPNRSGAIVMRTEASPDELVLDLADQPRVGPVGSWSNYPRGVVAGFRALGAAGEGFDAQVVSTVPIGAGLSSSAALSAAMATLLETAWRRPLDPVSKAQLCQSAEHKYANVPCGIMDPYIAVLGRAAHLLLLDCESNEPSWIPFEDQTVAVLIVNTNVRHQLADGAYGKRRARCEAAARALGLESLRAATMEGLHKAEHELDAMATRCARHVIGEIDRTQQAAQCARTGDWKRLGQLMYASHESLRADYDVSCPELDAIVSAAREIGIGGGVFGCRLTGGGFGGCAVALIRSDLREPIGSRLRQMYTERFGIEPSLFVSRPAAGASIEERAA